MSTCTPTSSFDYDMNSSDPTFTLAMRDITDLLACPNEIERKATAEYDYVQVEKSIIKEWRKFGVTSKTQLSDYKTKTSFISMRSCADSVGDMHKKSPTPLPRTIG